MKRVAVLASDNLMPGATNAQSDLSERDEQMYKLTAAFAAKDIELHFRPWRGAAEVAAEYDAMLPLMVWD